MDFKNRTLTFQCLSLIYLLACCIHNHLKFHKVSIPLTLMLYMSTLWQGLWSWERDKISYGFSDKDSLWTYLLIYISTALIKMVAQLLTTLPFYLWIQDSDKDKPSYEIYEGLNHLFWRGEGNIPSEAKTKVLLCLPKDNNSWFPNALCPSFPNFHNNFLKQENPLSIEWTISNSRILKCN